MSSTNVSGLTLRQPLQHLDAVDARQVDVAQGHVEPLLAGAARAPPRRCRRRDGEPLLLEVLGQRVADHRLVVDDQDGRPRAGAVLVMRSSSPPASPGGQPPRRDRRQAADPERRPLPGLRLERDRPAVGLDDPPGDEQPQPGAVLLGREVRAEQPRRGAPGRCRRRRRARSAPPAPSSAAAVTSIRPPLPVASMALRTRLKNTCTSWSRTPTSGGRSAATVAGDLRGSCRPCSTWRCPAPRRSPRGPTPGRAGRWPAG